MVTCTKGAVTHTVSLYSVSTPAAAGAESPLVVVVVVATGGCDCRDVGNGGGASAMTVWLKAFATESLVLLQRITGRHL